MNGIPEPILDALPTDTEELLDARLTRPEVSCEGAKHHSPTPLLVHPVRLPDGRRVLLCGTCRDSLRVLTLIGPDASWSVMRCFGNRLRLLLGHRFKRSLN